MSAFDAYCFRLDRIYQQISGLKVYIAAGGYEMLILPYVWIDGRRKHQLGHNGGTRQSFE